MGWSLRHTRGRAPRIRHLRSSKTEQESSGYPSSPLEHYSGKPPGLSLNSSAALDQDTARLLRQLPSNRYSLGPWGGLGLTLCGSASSGAGNAICEGGRSREFIGWYGLSSSRP